MNHETLSLPSGYPVASSLERLGSVRNAAGGTVLFRRGATAEGVYVIVSGRVELSLEVDSKSLLNRILGPGEIAGLPAAVSGEPYSLSATTLGACELSYVPRQAIMDVLKDDPRLGMTVVETLAHEVHLLRELWRGGCDSRAAEQ